MTQAHDQLADTKPLVAVYIGRRMTVKNKLAFFWLFDGEDKPRGYKKRLAHSAIGERWQFQADDTGAIRLGGDKAPTQLNVIDDVQKINEWTATDEANQQLEIARRVDRKLAARKTHFDEALEPVKAMLKELRTHDDRAAFIQRVTSELWRR
jgi:hypothetical protein